MTSRSPSTAHQHPDGPRGQDLLKHLQMHPEQLPDEINLDGCGLSELPAVIGSRTDFRRLSAYNNELKDLPGWLWTLGELRGLNLSANRLTTLPAGLGLLTRLEMLDLGHNALSRLPDTLGNLRNLRFLYLTSATIG